MMRSIAALALAAAAMPAIAATPTIDHDALDRAVADFAGAPAGSPGGAAAPIDRRLRLAACAGDVRLSWRSARRDTIVLECPLGAGWRVFVPMVSANLATAGQGAADAGMPAVARGDMVTIEAKGTGFTVSQSGQAMESGPAGSWIKIKSSGKGGILTCQVIRPGLVRLPAS